MGSSVYSWFVDPLSDEFVAADTPDNGSIALFLEGAPDETIPVSIAVRADKTTENVMLKRTLVRYAGHSVPECDIKHVCPIWRAGLSKYREIPILVPELLTNDPYFVVTRGPGENSFVDGYEDADELLPVTLEAGVTRQYLVDMKIPSDCAPGEYVFMFHLMTGSGILSSTAVYLKVLPITLPDPLIKYSISYRGQLADTDGGECNPDRKTISEYTADMKNMKAHGISNPFCYQQLDSPLMREALEIRRGAGMDNDPLFVIPFTVANYGDDNSENRLYRKSQFLAGRVFALETFTGHLRGFSLDERLGADIVKQIPYWDMAHDAGVEFYSASFNPQDLWDYAGSRPDSVLLHCPIDLHNGSLAGKIENTKRLIGLWHEANTECGYYDLTCMELPQTVRRRSGWYPHYMGFKRVCHYPYQERRPYAGGSCWDDFDTNNNNLLIHQFAYPGKNGPINTIKFKAFRAAVDDMRYAAALVAAGLPLPTDLYNPTVTRRWCITSLMGNKAKE